MTDFSTEAEVSSINIPDRALREAREEVEDSIGSVTVNVDGQGAGPGGGRGGMFAGSVALGEELGDQTELLSEIHDELKKIAVSGGGGGSGGAVSGFSGVAIGSALAGGSGGVLATLLAKSKGAGSQLASFLRSGRTGRIGSLGKSGLSRGLAGASKGLGRRIPVLNAALYGSEALGERSFGGLANVTGGFLGGTAGALAGAKGGAAAGAAAGSIVPGIGTGIGAGVGAVVGGVGGGILGDKAGRKIADGVVNAIPNIKAPTNLWPNLSAPSWPDISAPDWPDISEPEWPDISEPDWPDLSPPDDAWNLNLDLGSGGDPDAGTPEDVGESTVSPTNHTPAFTVNGRKFQPSAGDLPSQDDVPGWVQSKSATEKWSLWKQVQNNPEIDSFSDLRENGSSGAGSNNSSAGGQNRTTVDVNASVRVEDNRTGADPAEEIAEEVKKNVKNELRLEFSR
jgi:hypothetical protein